MLSNIHDKYVSGGIVRLRRHLQPPALNNIMGSVFRRRFDICDEMKNLRFEEVKENEERFELLGPLTQISPSPPLRFLDQLQHNIFWTECQVPNRDFHCHNFRNFIQFGLKLSMGIF